MVARAPEGSMARRRALLIRIVLLVCFLAPAGALPIESASGLADSVGYAWGDFDGDGFADVAIGSAGESIGAKKSAGAVHVLYGGSGGLSGAGDQYWHQDTVGVPSFPETEDRFGAAVAAGDFDEDGIDDLAIGAPGESVDGAAKAGVVIVLRGSASGLTGEGNQLLYQGTAAIGGNLEAGDEFGTALASGDFNNDNIDDLAVGVAGENTNGFTDAGTVNILPGAPVFGLSGANGRTITQETSGITGGSETSDRFGSALSSGDYNNDGEDDLAIGAHLEDVGPDANAGAVWVLNGAPTGLETAGSQLHTQDTIFTTRQAGENDGFGFALASGDFNPDHANPDYEDLAVGAPGDFGSGRGAVIVMHGSANGLGYPGQLIRQGIAGPEGGAFPGTSQSGDKFGYALTANDFGIDGAADLAIGSPGENGSVADIGLVYVIYSDGDGLDPQIGPAQIWGQHSAGVLGSSESGDQFGTSLWSGDTDGNGAADLMIGVPFENIGSATDAGAVNVLYSNGAKVIATNGDLFYEDASSINGSSESGDRFGNAAG
jgi:hypothetical protein